MSSPKKYIPAVARSTRKQEPQTQKTTSEEMEVEINKYVKRTMP